MIPDETISRIRDRASIVEVVSDYLTLKKAGRNYMGLCPFHSEKTPSFTVNEEKGIFRCFGCGAGGSVFHFLMSYDHLSFPEAVERVGKRYGIEVERLQSPGAKRSAEEKEALYRLNERAASYFQENLYGPGEGRHALEYLRKRGVDERTARRFYVGYAPQSGPGLAGYFKKQGLSLKDAVRVGLVSDRGGERYGEKFFGRVMFPIADAGGKIVGFGGRVLGQGMPKYLNSSETPLFRKHATVYGLFQAKESIREKDRVVVVEGYLDVVALAQFGIGDAVATLGTALTPDHVRMLGRYTKNIIALFDGDGAGRKAAARSFEIFVEAGLMGRGAFLPKEHDPDSFVRAYGKDGLEKLLGEAIPLADYYFTWLEEGYGRSLEGKSRIAQEINRVLAKVKNPFEADLLVRRAVDQLNIRETLLRAPLGQGEVRPAAKAAAAQPVESGPPRDAAERSLIGLMLRFPAMIERIEPNTEGDRLVGPEWTDIFNAIVSEWRERGDVDGATVAAKLPPERAAAVAALTLEGEAVEEAEAAKMLGDVIAHLQRRRLRGLERDLRRAIRIAEEKKDEKTKKERMLEWQEVVRRERQLMRQRSASRN
ncbi:MAG TPA: DNA primase, partial [Candidatus Binatia bacterium]